MDWIKILFYAFAATAVVSAGAVISVRNPVNAVLCLILLLRLMARENTRNFFLVYLAIGIVIYFVYGMWNSKIGKGIVVHGHEVLAESPHPKGLD